MIFLAINAAFHAMDHLFQIVFHANNMIILVIMDIVRKII